VCCSTIGCSATDVSVPERPELRVGDEVRNRVVDDLRVHFAAGRLNLTEFEERTSAALAAVTVADLQPLLRDLPDARIRTQSGPPVRQPAPRVRSTEPWDVLYRIHVGVWVVLVVFFVLIWLFAGGGYFWPIWPAMGIGLSVGIHGAVKKGVQG
jgi:hypothetical protein